MLYLSNCKLANLFNNHAFKTDMLQVDWSIIARDQGINTAHAARMRWHRLKHQMEGTQPRVGVRAKRKQKGPAPFDDDISRMKRGFKKMKRSSEGDEDDDEEDVKPAIKRRKPSSSDDDMPLARKVKTRHVKDEPEEAHFLKRESECSVVAAQPDPPPVSGKVVKTEMDQEVDMLHRPGAGQAELLDEQPGFVKSELDLEAF